MGLHRDGPYRVSPAPGSGVARLRVLPAGTSFQSVLLSDRKRPQPLGCAPQRTVDDPVDANMSGDRILARRVACDRSACGALEGRGRIGDVKGD